MKMNLETCGVPKVYYDTLSKEISVKAEVIIDGLVVPIEIKGDLRDNE